MTDVTTLLAGIKTRTTAALDYPGHVTVEQSAADVPRLVAALEAVAGLHRETGRDFITASACIREECDHEDKCPIESLPVCRHCWEQLEQIDPYFGEDHHISEVMWPCPTINAVVAALGGGE